MDITLEEKGIQQALDLDPRDRVARLALADLLTELDDERAPGCRALTRWGRVPRFTARTARAVDPPQDVYGRDHWYYGWNATADWWAWVTGVRTVPKFLSLYVQGTLELPECWTHVAQGRSSFREHEPMSAEYVARYALGAVRRDYVIAHGGRHVRREALENMAMVRFAWMAPEIRHILLTHEVPDGGPTRT